MYNAFVYHIAYLQYRSAVNILYIFRKNIEHILDGSYSCVVGTTKDEYFDKYII